VAGEYPSGLAIGDFNGDDNLDLVTANRDADTVSVLLGTGDGRFRPKLNYPTGSKPNAVAVGDLDGDGALDVVVVNSFASSVSVLLGTGQGKVATRVDYSTDDLPWALALGDLNGDGKLDVAVAASSVSVLLGSGDGTLEAKVSYATALDAESISIADLNLDDKPDLVVPCWVGSASVLLGMGDGTFLDKTDYPISPGAVAGVAGDLDGTDGADLVTVDSMSNVVSVLPSTAGGGLGAGVSYPVGGIPDSDNPYNYPGNVGVSPEGVALGDLDADGYLDVIVANGGSVGVLLGTGDGTLGAVSEYPTAGLALAVVAGDLNGDGKLDLAVTNGDADTVSVLLGNGDGTFKDGVLRIDHAVGGYIVSAGVLGDLDGDKKPDLVVSGYDDWMGTGEATVLLGVGNGQFVTAASYSVAPAWGMVLGDVNGDETPDLVTANTYVDSVSVWLGTGIGTGEFADRMDYPTGTEPHGVALGDLNGDGRLDIVTPSATSDSVSVLLNTGRGDFVPKVEYPTDRYPSAVAVADLDGDGNLDVATANSIYYSVSVLLGRGDGTFAPRVDFTSGTASAIALGDVNADEKLDVVVNNVFVGAGILLGNGDGTFGAQLDYPIGHDPVSIALADMTADGRPDVVLLGRDSKTITVLPSTPTGIAHQGFDYSIGSAETVEWVAAGDLDGDGRVDLVVPTDPGMVSTLLNRAP
jgi:hypothetical protein